MAILIEIAFAQPITRCAVSSWCLILSHFEVEDLPFSPWLPFILRELWPASACLSPVSKVHAEDGCAVLLLARYDVSCIVIHVSARERENKWHVSTCLRCLGLYHCLRAMGYLLL